MANKKEPGDWQWTDNGVTDYDQLLQRVIGIVSPYEAAKKPFCYPGTTLDFDPRVRGLIADFLAKQLNSIGTHTHGKFDKKTGEWQSQIGEGGFDDIHAFERYAIWMISQLVGGSPELTDGYFCGGATEANIQGMWVGREWLRQRPDPAGRGIVVLTTPLIHYSVIKGAEILDIGHPQWTHCPKCRLNHLFLADPSGAGVNMVGMDALGRMDMDDLARVYTLKYNEGFRRFLIVPTVGTTLLGSVDPIGKINEFADDIRREGAQAYIHVDAAFGGFTVPFVASGADLEIGFQHSNVMSMALDGDKMGQMPYPAGVFLCRNRLQELIAMKVNYVRGHEDDTLSGSRSALASVLAWLNFQSKGKLGQARYVQNCLNVRDRLRALIDIRFCGEEIVQTIDPDPHINLLGMRIGTTENDLEVEKHPAMEPYHLRYDFMPGTPHDIFSCPHKIYKLCVMPHNTLEQAQKFVDDLETAVRDCT